MIFHPFAASVDPRKAHSCVKCGRTAEQHSEDEEARRLAAQAAGYLRSAVDQLEAARRELEGITHAREALRRADWNDIANGRDA